MSMQNDSNKVLVVGGGIAGLAFAQILRKHNVPCQVFERDEPSHVRAQGWAVLLIECLNGLSELLPDDLGDLREVSVNHHTKDADVLSVCEGTSMKQIASYGNAPYGSPGFAIRAHREHLRQYLSQHLDIQGGKRFERYEEDDTGVTVFFRDGTSVRGAILVGADGGHSRVRSQLLHAEPVMSKYINLIGAGEVGPEIYEPVRERGTAAIITLQKDFRVLIGQLYMKPDFSAAGFYWFVTYKADDPVAENKWITTASKQELFERAMQITTTTSPFMVQKLRAMGPESMYLNPVKYIEYVTPEQMPKSRVTLIGDALHTMIPFKAAGANTALLDSCDLARIISQNYRPHQDTDWSSIFDQYHTVALPRGREIVLASRAAGDEDGQ